MYKTVFKPAVSRLLLVREAASMASPMIQCRSNDVMFCSATTSISRRLITCPREGGGHL
jgi:hypothetical protein